MLPVGLHLHEHNLPFCRNVGDNIQFTTPVPTTRPHIPANDPPPDPLQMRGGDILPPAATPDTGVHVPYGGRIHIADHHFNKSPDHDHSPIP
jgi:hypothetical protein